jgi:hypothetical protein
VRTIAAVDGGFTIRLVTDPMVLMSLAVMVVLWAVLLVFLVSIRPKFRGPSFAYQRRSKRQARSTATVRPQPGVSWQAGRWDTDPRHAYVANVGDDTAYEVSVTACDRLIGRASSVPPYRTDRLSSSSEPPCYVNFCVDERLKRQISLGADRATQSAQDNAVDPDGLEVAVRVSWRSEHGEWFTQTVRTD